MQPLKFLSDQTDDDDDGPLIENGASVNTMLALLCFVKRVKLAF